MTIDLTTDPALRPAQAARLIPPSRTGKPTHPATIIRWIVRGYPLPDGVRLRLQAVRLPSGWVTTPGAIREFVAALTAAHIGGAEPAVEGGVASRRREGERVARELERIGFPRADSRAPAGTRRAGGEPPSG